MLLGGLSAPSARAQWIVNDPINLVQNTATALQTLEVMRKQIDQLRNEALMLKRLAAPPWREIRLITDQVDALMREGEALAYSTDGLLGEFGLTFPGFQTYTNWSEEKRAQFRRTLGTYQNVLMSLNRQHRQFEESRATLGEIKSRMRAAEGQTASIQLGNTIGTFTAEELMLIRQILATQANAQAVHDAYEINREAQEMAARQAFYQGMAAQPRASGNTYTGINEPEQ